MDMLSKRYACPFFILDEFIKLKQLKEYTSELFQITSEEQKWEFYLHKVYNMTFEEFLNESKKESKTMNKEDIKNVADSSRRMLDTYTFE